MSLKQEIETWVAALAHYDKEEFQEAYQMFDTIMDTSKILFNCGVIQATLGDHDKAVELYQRAISLDQYLAVAYFQQGVSNFLLGDFSEALANFNDTLLYLRGNNMIDYSQIGLSFKLYSCEALFNRGLCYIYLGQRESGMKDLTFAVKEKAIEDHNVIDDAITEEAEGYTVFSIPVGVVYRPNQSKVKNLKTKDYLGRARLIAASDRSDAFTGFTGSEIKNAGKTDGKDDRPTENLSFAATNLVKPGLSSKRPDQDPSSVFPPTPPPEGDKTVPTPIRSRAASVKNGPRPILPRLSVDKGVDKVRSGDNREDQSPLQVRRARSSTETKISTGRPNIGREQRSMSKSRIPNEDIYPGELYDMYSNNQSRSIARRGARRSYEEVDEMASDYEGDSIDEDDFEMIPMRGARSQTWSSIGSRRGSRRIEIRSVRIKVHCEDVRYIMVNVDVDFRELVDRIREKFGLRNPFKIKVREEDMPNGDMITMGDQDDLDMIIMASKSAAKKERVEIGRMEIWINEL